MKSPIELERYFVTDQAVTARAAYDPEQEIATRIEEYSVENKARHLQEEAQVSDTWEVSVTIKHQPSPETNFPYDFRLTIVGIFRSTVADAKPEMVERLMKINGSSILYGMAREIIRANTERGPWNGIVIPTHSFYEPKVSPTESEESAV
jgi:preprotein translocase subunit SecB